ncbi:hypothetical protein RA279_28295, partial [Pseudomonas syringae pv. tagetis]|uniref:hypothetical protein n=1 Tax=Pseudomonas syringae group genomosp. 7 TaxID=251699 RepID=UPI0037704A6C
LQQCAAALCKVMRERAALRDTLQGERDLHAREQAMMDVINMHSHDLKYRLWREEQKRIPKALLPHRRGGSRLFRQKRSQLRQK